MVTGLKKKSNSTLYLADAFIALNSAQSYSLSVLTAPSGTHFCVRDTVTHQLLAYEVWNDLSSALESSQLSALQFKTVLGLVQSEYFTAMPSSLYEDEQLAAYLQLNFGAIPINSQCLAYALPTLQLVGISAVDATTYTALAKQWPYANISHPATHFLKLAMPSAAEKGMCLAVHFFERSFIVAAFQEQALLWINQFAFDTSEDVLYYLLNGLQQIDVSPDSTALQLMGSIHKEHSSYTLLSKYFPHIAIEELQQTFAKAEFFANFETAKHQMLLHQ